jgi:DNA-binding response OmpR family regulator
MHQLADGPLQVLVVEDDGPLLEAMANVLSRAGFIAVTAGSCADTVAAGRAGCPDAAIIDVCLPDGAGLGVATGLRRLFAGLPGSSSQALCYRPFAPPCSRRRCS